MNLRLSALTAAAGAMLLPASSIAPAQTDAYATRAANKLAKALAGRAPGEPVSCISNSRGSQMQVIDDNTILFREGGTVFVQKPFGGCHGIGGGYSLVTHINATSRLCSGQIAQVVDQVSGFPYSSCVFSEFVPYRKTGLSRSN